MPDVAGARIPVLADLRMEVSWKDEPLSSWRCYTATSRDWICCAARLVAEPQVFADSVANDRLAGRASNPQSPGAVRRFQIGGVSCSNSGHAVVITSTSDWRDALRAARHTLRRRRAAASHSPWRPDRKPPRLTPLDEQMLGQVQTLRFLDDLGIGLVGESQDAHGSAFGQTGADRFRPGAGPAAGSAASVASASSAGAPVGARQSGKCDVIAREAGAAVAQRALQILRARCGYRIRWRR